MSTQNMSTQKKRPHSVFARLPLMWKLLLPFLVLDLVIGYFGAAVLTHDLRGRANATIDGELTREYFLAGSLLHDMELSLSESANLAANLSGMADAVGSRDPARVRILLRSVVALKPGLRLLAVTDRGGGGLAEFTREADGVTPAVSRGTAWRNIDAVSTALTARTQQVFPTLAMVQGQTELLLVLPICTQTQRCAATGAAIVGVPLSAAVAAVRPSAVARGGLGRASVAIFATDRHPLAGASPSWPRPPATQTSGVVRVTTGSGSSASATIYGPFVVAHQRLGTVGVRAATGGILTAARRTDRQLVALLVIAMAATVLLGAVLTQALARRIRRILGTVQRIGAGDLAARTTLTADDELTSLADGVNSMAEQIEASYNTLEMRVAQRTEEVRRLLEARTEFFAGLTHDLRTPLAVLLAQADLLSQADEDGIVRTGDIVRESAEQLLTLVNDIIEVARVETGRLDLATSALSLADEMASIEPTVQALARTGDLELQVEIPEDLPRVSADPIRLRESVLNLVHNAVKYTQPGGRITVSASRDDEGEQVQITVEDSGIGIPDDAGDSIFEPFRRVAGNAAVRGDPSSGLGLAITRRLVEAMGGSIGYTSEVGVGSRFWFTLPRATVEEHLVYRQG
jgi:signal transduction histidine kinase